MKVSLMVTIIRAVITIGAAAVSVVLIYCVAWLIGVVE